MDVISIKKVKKMFRLYHERHQTLKDTILSRRSGGFEEFWALNGIDLQIKQGQTIGFIGENGSGKSTLLKIITGILVPTEGEVSVDGKVSALLELGAGFHPDLTGRENIYMNGALLRMSKKEINERFDSIVQFAELEKFIDMPVKNYSSGMYMRLGFSIAIHVDPDILLIDEILAVGDESFQAKCFDAVMDFKRQGKTIVLVTHDLEAVRRFCDTAVWLDDGVIRASGPTTSVIQSYLKEVHIRELNAQTEDLQKKLSRGSRWGTGEAVIRDVEFLDENDKPSGYYEPDRPMKIKITYDVDAAVEGAVFGVAIFSNEGAYCYGTNTLNDGVSVPNGKGSVTITYPRMPLLQGTYLVDVGIYDRTATQPYDYISKAYDFRIRSDSRDSGMFHIDHKWEIAP